MNINRNNYEEFFLLYADNELSKTERKVVEIFVQENPDLKEEFSMWKLSVNSPDEGVKLLDKSFLLKKESSFINENNYEEIFVLYYDNELSTEQKKETENFIIENSKFKEDFELIGKAKLIPENSIVYTGKKQLYRKEKSGRKIPMILWRSIAAAIFIGFGLWITVSYFNKKEVSQSVATTKNSNAHKPVIKEVTPGTKSVNQKPGKEENNMASSTKTTEPSRIKKNETEVEKPVLKEQKINEQTIANNDAKANNKPAELKINTTKTNDDSQLAASAKPVKDLPAIIEKNKTPLTDNHNAMQTPKIDTDIQNGRPKVQTASYVSDADASNQNYVFYDVPAEEFRKSKVGGFLKKVKRVVERNNPINRLFDADEEQISAK
ncbi:MAG TPA: hypothetical protein VMU83_02780 [Hanamia sp.]|nr:hypothetical protein [Hanamia sp.]